ncbi:hypothetical protein DFQ27_003965 [Actinomortierella ambigua]|uniref:F-box domain-containing protein n=1 Tax=Actinomortierella ambigua TaxID=1343610 RepID=A0A9P6Q4V3_9FUNG|nr:hypothetical protein DFQ27_003965 [Actinomortierella ambigua]
MLKFVKEGALDILALTLPSSLLESIRKISEEELLPPSPVSHKQRQPRARTQKQAQQETANFRRHQDQDQDQGPRGLQARHHSERDTLVFPGDHHKQSLIAVHLNTTQQHNDDNDPCSQQRSSQRPLNLRSLDHTQEDDDDEGWWRRASKLSIHPHDQNPLLQQGGNHSLYADDDSDYDSIEVDSDYDSDVYAMGDSPDQQRRVQDLPYEVLAHILGFLPASDLMSALSVCRQWRQIALLETRQVDISECFPQDCLGLDSREEYSDFEFVVHLFSTFPLISTIIIKERYLRDRDMRVVTAGILAGKMAFTHWSPHFAEMERQYQLHLNASSSSSTLAPQSQDRQDNTEERAQPQQCSPHGITCTATCNSSNSGHTRIIPKIMRGSIKEELLRFSRSVATYVLVPQTRNTLRKKIQAQLQANLEQKHQQDYWWMVQEGFQPERRPPVNASTITDKHALVPITHYRFQDCCFANDWGANMDLNKLPMIGLAAAISNQGLVVDLDGSYGAPSKSVKTMLGFCFGPNCVISLAFGFRHTHMELEHVTEMMSENNILYRMDIVNAPAYQDLILLPALRGLGRLLTQMQRCCLELDEQGLQINLQEAATVFQGLARDLALAEEIIQDDTKEDEEEDCEEQQRNKGARTSGDRSPRPLSTSSRSALLKNQGANGAAASFVDPIEALAGQLVFPPSAKDQDKQRTAKVILRGVVAEGLKGLLSTRDKTTGQALLHTLAWRRHYSSTMAQLESQEAQATKREGRRKRAHHPSKPSTTTRSTSMDSIFPSSQQPQRRPSSSDHRRQQPQHQEPMQHQQHQQQQQQSQPIAVPTARESGFLSTSPPSLAILRAALPAALSSFPLTLRRRSLPLVWFGSSPPRWSTSHGSDSESSSSSSSSKGDEDSDDSESDHETGAEGEKEEGEEQKGRAVGSLSKNILQRQHGNLGDNDGENDCYSDGDDNDEHDHEHDGEEATDWLLLGFPWSREERRQLARLDHYHPILVALRMAKVLLDKGADPNVFNNDGRPAAVCASFMGFQPMETLLVRHGGILRELTRIRETM